VKPLVKRGKPIVRFLQTMVKVLISGDVCGRLGALADKVQALNESKHGPFDGVLCAGEFFAPDPSDGDLQAFLNGERTFPIPLYFVTGKNAFDGLQKDGNLLAPGIHFLGSVGLRSIAELDGLKVMFLSGCDEEASSGSSSPQQFAEEGLQLLLGALEEEHAKNGTANVDVLLTPDWPKDVLSCLGPSTKPGIELENATLSQAARRSCVAAMPRYHFAGSRSVFFQRFPFKNGPFFTRFIALGKVDSKNKQRSKKWLHALSFEPLWKQIESDGNAQTPELGANPFSEETKHFMDKRSDSSSRMDQIGKGSLSAEQIARIMAEESAKDNQFFYARKRQAVGDRPRKKRRRRNNVAPREDCWYCLASPSCQTHLIASIGEDVFLTLPKGGISAQHVQIVPIAHEESFAALDGACLKQAIQFKLALEKFFASFDCIPLVYERNIILEKAMQRHAFVDVIPISKKDAGKLKDALARQQERAKISFEENLEPASKEFSDDEEIRRDGLAAMKARIGESTTEYLYIEAPGFLEPRICIIEETENSESRKSMPLFFGRAVACDVMGNLGRVSWKDCLVPQHLEERMAMDFKASFKPFDPF